MSKVNLEDILDESLDRIADGETVEDCVAAYPEHAQALLPLLEAALALRQEVASAPFRPAAKARSLQRLLSSVEDRQPSRRRWFTVMPPISRPVGVALASLVVVLVAAGWTTSAASNTVPGDPLYWVKGVKESAMLKIPRSDVAQAQVHADLARTRVQEMRRLVASGRVQEAELLLARLDHHLSELATYIGVTVASDPIEMPVARVRFASTGEVSSIARRLERDERWLKTRFQAVADDMDSDMGQQVGRVRRLSDLRYRTVIAALDATHSSGTRLFWRNANAHLAQR